MVFASTHGWLKHLLKEDVLRARMRSMVGGFWSIDGWSTHWFGWILKIPNFKLFRNTFSNFWIENPSKLHRDFKIMWGYPWFSKIRAISIEKFILKFSRIFPSGRPIRPIEAQNTPLKGVFHVCEATNGPHIRGFDEEMCLVVEYFSKEMNEYELMLCQHAAQPRRNSFLIFILTLGAVSGQAKETKINVNA